MKLDSLVVNMAVKNIHESCLFYRENFGFELVDAVIANNTQYDGVTTELKNGVEYQWAMIKKGKRQIATKTQTTVVRTTTGVKRIRTD